MNHGSIPGRGVEFFSSLKTYKLDVGPIQPTTQRVPGAFAPGVKQMGREAHSSPQSCARVKN
jgi:hypothetical protein